MKRPKIQIMTLVGKHRTTSGEQAQANNKESL
jgi:hypothetical protein